MGSDVSPDVGMTNVMGKQPVMCERSLLRKNFTMLLALWLPLQPSLLFSKSRCLHAILRAQFLHRRGEMVADGAFRQR